MEKHTDETRERMSRANRHRPTEKSNREPDGSRSPVLSAAVQAAAVAVSPVNTTLGISSVQRRGNQNPTIAQLAAEFGPRAVAVLAEIMMNEKAPLSERRLSAVALLDRAYGRPAQSLDIDARTTDMTALHLEALKRLSEPLHPDKRVTIDAKPLT